MSGLSDAERDELCICPWDVVGPTPDTTHEYRCTRHMEKITAREAALRERIAAAIEANWSKQTAYDINHLRDRIFIPVEEAAKIVRETP